MDKVRNNPEFPLWLLGDSNPARWAPHLDHPLDARHPARHNIWTSVCDVFQDRLYRERRLRLDTSRMYERNAVEDSQDKPKANALQWTGTVQCELDEYRQLIQESGHLSAIFTLGAFAFEFARRACEKGDPRPYGSWGARDLGGAFRRSIEGFGQGGVSVIPLLHCSIARGKFLKAHDYFCRDRQNPNHSECANYFEYVGERIAEALLRFGADSPIWVG